MSCKHVSDMLCVWSGLTWRVCVLEARVLGAVMTLHFTAYSSEVNEPHRHIRPTQTQKHAADASPTLYRKYFKRLMDCTLIILALPIVLPIFAVAAVLVAMDGRNPFYGQMRVGRDGRHFCMWKLRTMVHNADALLEACLAADPQARQEWETTQKLKRDPRITFIGRFMRKTSIDELPQLLNVLNGTMSLVGPRPMMVCQKSSYPGTLYYEMRPGITGMWQVSDRNECEFSQRADYDDAYYQNMTFKTDVKILAQTVGVVLKATGH